MRAPQIAKVTPWSTRSTTPRTLFRWLRLPPRCRFELNFKNTRTGDRWCKQHLVNYLAWAKTRNTILILTTDESDTDKTNRIMTVFAGDSALIQAGTSDQYLSHFDLPRSVESMLSTEYAGFSSLVYGPVFINGKIVATKPAPLPQTVTETLSGTTGSGAQ